jgi:hypothetical protein
MGSGATTNTASLSLPSTSPASPPRTGRAGGRPQAGGVPAPGSSAAPGPAPVPTIIATIGDLQRVGPAALQAAKAKMDVVFDAKRIKPGDPGFVYDRRVDFMPLEGSDWDSEGDGGV